jgi:hypothetical protein
MTTTTTTTTTMTMTVTMTACLLVERRAVELVQHLLLPSLILPNFALSFEAGLAIMQLSALLKNTSYYHTWIHKVVVVCHTRQASHVLLLSATNWLLTTGCATDLSKFDVPSGDRFHHPVHHHSPLVGDRTNAAQSPNAKRHIAQYARSRSTNRRYPTTPTTDAGDLHMFFALGHCRM